MHHSDFTAMSLALLTCLLAMILGCGTGSQESTTEFVNEVGLPTVSGRELERFVQASQVPVLVEFGVDFNCPRCAQTKSDVVRLRESLEGKVDVIRVDFNANAQMVAKLGGTICPTYVLFDHGQPVLTRSFPVSIDLLEGEILRLEGDSGK
ncbi:Thioredoxin-1 [Stieleria neptunia]|uniref:Thioredoxin-1 n=1 Tax=Stieleria neptunia TaxID=2527979 RepID=A0A518HYC8_9BACT|nr:thioredoxin domain-containing protein [Stieleria neptunia]QDV45850.1 Thioredoxin-1 [Stieleria neptunia]